MTKDTKYKLDLVDTTSFKKYKFATSRNPDL